MLELVGRAYPNVDFRSPVYRFDRLCETVFLAGVFDSLRALMGSTFEAYHFIIFAGPDSSDLSIASDPARTVVLHISDESASVPYALCARVRAVFKCYLPAEGLARNLHSFPLGYVASTPLCRPVAVNERPQSLFFSGRFIPSREKMFQAFATPWFFPSPAPLRLLSLLNPSKTCDRFMPASYIRFTDGFRHGLDEHTYAEHLANSKIVLCPPGLLSAETFRHYEAMRAGAILFSEQLPPLRLYVGSPIVVVDNWRHTRRAAARVLADPQALAERQAATLAWWRDVCSEQATAEKIADVLS